MLRILAAVGILIAGVTSTFAADDDAELAKKLSNPVADLASIPFQFNYNAAVLTRLGGGL